MGGVGEEEIAFIFRLVDKFSNVDSIHCREIHYSKHRACRVLDLNLINRPFDE